ncbi:MAG TPA: hypothetical protein VIL37_06785 [Natronosporangium sp.]
MHPKPHQALAQLERFVGTWDVTATFGGEPAGGVTVSFEWLEGGAYLLQRSVAEAIDAPPEVLATLPFPAVQIFGYDDTAEVYTALYADGRGVARVYQMRLTGNRWEIWRDAPGFGQRFIGEFDPDGRVITGRWELSRDNQTWEHDFHMTYTKRG